jgi:hypothetical protein
MWKESRTVMRHQEELEVANETESWDEKEDDADAPTRHERCQDHGDLDDSGAASNKITDTWL